MNGASDYIQEIERLESLDLCHVWNHVVQRLERSRATLNLLTLNFEPRFQRLGLGVPGGMALHRQALGHRLLLGVT
mgnify:CR=1 FL=1